MQHKTLSHLEMNYLFLFAVEGPEEKQQKITPLYKSNLDKGFTSDEIVRLLDYKAPLPSQILKSHIEGHINLDEYHKDIGEEIKSLGRKKGVLMKSKKLAGNNKNKIDDVTYILYWLVPKGLFRDIKLLQKYRDRLDLIRKGSETLGKGIYTQKKRNAYKISQKGQYGGLVIDLPKLHGHLKVVAHKNGKKVYDKQADFDTLDLLTKRFNSRNNYSQLARTVFNDLNKLSEIPIHRTSKKYSKLGSGVFYYNDPQDLLSRLELLGGSISAGNNSNAVREEFSNIVHKLNKLNIINNEQMSDLIKEYLIY